MTLMGAAVQDEQACSHRLFKQGCPVLHPTKDTGDTYAAARRQPQETSCYIKRRPIGLRAQAES